VKCPYGGKNEKIIPGEHFKFLCFERNGCYVWSQMFGVKKF
jgi:hypothetical protein